MEGSVSLGVAGRKGLMEMYRKHPDPEVRRRGHIVSLLADGRSWSEVESVLYCSRRTIARRTKRMGIDGLSPDANREFC